MKLPANIAILILMHNLASSSGAAQPANGVALAGSSPASPAVLNLAAGPIQLTFADGELRRLWVGDKEIIRRNQGQPVLATAIEPAQHSPFEALAFADHGTTYVFLVNLTPGKRAIRLEGLPAKAMLEQQRVTAEASPNAIPPWMQSKSKSGRWELTLAPFEVCQVRVTPAIN